MLYCVLPHALTCSARELLWGMHMGIKSARSEPCRCVAQIARLEWQAHWAAPRVAGALMGAGPGHEPRAGRRCGTHRRRHGRARDGRDKHHAAGGALLHDSHWLPACCYSAALPTMHLAFQGCATCRQLATIPLLLGSLVMAACCLGLLPRAACLHTCQPQLLPPLAVPRSVFA
jgi:hypothetical protein